MTKLTAEEVNQIIADSTEQLNNVISQAQSQIESTINGFEQKQARTIQTLADLIETLQGTQGQQANINPETLQKNMMACVRGECRRLQMNINVVKQEQSRQGQLMNAIPQQVQNQITQALPPQREPTMFNCEVCGSQFSQGVERCPACGVFLDWSGSS